MPVFNLNRWFSRKLCKLILLSAVIILPFLIFSGCQGEQPETPKNVLYSELTPTMFRERIKEAPIAYLPLGTLEWHGEHLPLGADGIQPYNFFQLLAREVGGIVYPPMFLGPDMVKRVDERDYYGMDFFCSDTVRQLDGSAYWIPDSLFAGIMEATLKQMKRAGFKIVVAHGHGPSTHTVIKMKDIWEEKFGLSILTCWGHRHSEGLGIMIDHAAANETSLTWYFRPELVKMEYLPADTSLALNGVAGMDPRIYASPERGEEIVRVQLEYMKNKIYEISGQ